MKVLEKVLASVLLGILLLISLRGSEARLDTLEARLRIYAQGQIFAGVDWVINAIWVKSGQNALIPHYTIPPEQRRAIVDEAIQLVRDASQVQAEIDRIFADPNIPDAIAASAEQRAQLTEIQARQALVNPLAESILQEQVETVLEEIGLMHPFMPDPSALYHATPLPYSLVISPRERIEQETNLLISTSISVDAMEELEDKISKAENVSALVVPVGGIALYPTMVMQTDSLPWLIEVIAHEWVHIYLNTRPLGQNYSTTPELRTMNETAASIAGVELSGMVMQRYYPDLWAKLHLRQQGNARPPVETFDYRAEMHQTRIVTDALLASGEIEEAEAYMELRRQVFWENGYQIRKLNQAYFAFYGAYADTPGGAAGEDPVGPAVRALREKSSSLKDFLEIIGEMDDFSQLQEATVK